MSHLPFLGDTLSHSKLTVAEVLELLGVSIAEFATQAGLSKNTVALLVRQANTFKTNVTVAEAVAHTAGLDVTDINWPSGISHIGRPAHTGKPISATLTVTYEACPQCFIALPATGVCDECT